MFFPLDVAENGEECCVWSKSEFLSFVVVLPIFSEGKWRVLYVGNCFNILELSSAMKCACDYSVLRQEHQNDSKGISYVRHPCVEATYI